MLHAQLIKKKLLSDHIPYHMIHGLQKVEMPSEEDRWLSYKDVGQQLRVPYVIYADFESFPVKLAGCDPFKDASYTGKSDKTCGIWLHHHDHQSQGVGGLPSLYI